MKFWNNLLEKMQWVKYNPMNSSDGSVWKSRQPSPEINDEIIACDCEKYSWNCQQAIIDFCEA